MICAACEAPHQPAQRFCAECGSALQTCSAPAAIAAEIVTIPPVIAASLPRTIGERRDVSILFADLSNYTGLSTELDAEDLHIIVRTYTQQVTAVMHAFGGTVERYIGDSVMAVFGAPVAHGDDAMRAVRAALAIQADVMPALSAQCARPLHASIGISFGEVVFTLGEWGHPEGLAVVGEAVNLAARVQGQAGAGNIVVTDTLRLACGPHIAVEFFTEASLKGIAQPVKLHRILGLAGADSGSQSRLLGRDRELAVMQEAVERCVRQSSGGLLHFRGEPGIGKSRLLEELNVIGQRAGLVRHACAYLDFGLEQSLSGMSALVASLLGISAGDGAIARQAAIMQAIGGGLLEPEATPFATDALRLPQSVADRAVLDALEPAARQAAYRAFVVTLITRSARSQPLLLTIEDVHWMPASERDALLAVCELAHTEPLIVATASREAGDPLVDYCSQFNAPGVVHVLNIGPISVEAARQIAQEFNPEHLSFVEACVAQADGNPLFLEQLLRHSAETGKTTIPGSINNVVLARLGRLDAADRHAAQCAAVIGQRFGLGLLRRLLPDELYDPVSLVLANIIRSQGADWIFSHALVQESAYGSLLHSAARAMHREAAAYYHAIDLILRAQHLDRAKAVEAARAYLEAATEQLTSYHFDRARELLARGLEVASSLHDVVDLRLLQGRTLHDQGLIQESMQCCQRALDEACDPGQQGRAWLGLAMGMRMTDDLEGAFHALAQAEPLALAANLEAELSEVHYLRGNLHFPRGELDQCLSEHGQALQWALRIGSALGEARALGGLGDAHYAHSRMKTAQGYFERCMQLCKTHGFGRIEAANRFMLATVRMYMNELDAALDDALQSAELGRRLGHHRAQVVSRLTAGWIYLQQAQPEKAAVQVQWGLECTAELGAPRFRAFLLESSARIQLAAGDEEGAMKTINDALELAQSLNVMRFIGPWILGTHALASPDADRARASLVQGQALINAGCVGHNYFWFYKHAMQSSLRHRDPASALGYAQRLEDHTQAEPTPWGRLFIERTRVLAELQREPYSSSLAQRAQQLLHTLEKTGHHEAAQALMVARAV